MVAQAQEFFQRQQTSANTPIWREYFMGADWLALRWSPVYYGLGVPRGDGSAVVLVPGFLATDAYLGEFYFWLARVGYRPSMSHIGRNADCLDILVDKLTETIKKAYSQTGRKVHLIGHSLGGILSRAAAILYPDMVASVTTLGSPFRGISSHPFVMRTSDFVAARIKSQGKRPDKPACFTSHCNCKTSDSLQNDLPLPIRQTAIYTKTDGIVDWRKCLNDDPRTNFEVIGTHGGLAFNPQVYQLVAQQLAKRSK